MTTEHTTHDNHPAGRGGISRREFLRRMGALALGALAAGCGRSAPTVTPAPAPITEATSAPAAAPTRVPSATPTEAPTVAPTNSPTPPPPTAAAVPPTATAVPADTATPPPTPTPQSPTVAIARAGSYERELVRSQMRALLDGLGGLGDVVSAGDRVAIKVNLTGGTQYSGVPGYSRVESYMTHPEVVRALGEALRDAGAREIYILEAVFDAVSFREFGYEDVAQALGATLVDLNAPAPYADFATVPVGEGWFMYESWQFNRILPEADVFVSVGKMKCHYNAGLTLSMKNLIGLAPVSQYRLAPDHWWRSALHGQNDAEAKSRLPRVIVDLNRARPIDLAVVDGIKSAEGGEVPRGSFHPVQPGLLLAGKNAVSTDAVGAAVMGFDPTVEPPTAPFLRGDNYLNLARGLGMGTNRLEEIAVAGEPIAGVRFPFQPSSS